MDAKQYNTQKRTSHVCRLDKVFTDVLWGRGGWEEGEVWEGCGCRAEKESIIEFKWPPNGQLLTKSYCSKDDSPAHWLDNVFPDVLLGVRGGEEDEKLAVVEEL